METVALIDYGSGNLRSAEKALVAAAGEVSSSPRVLVTADPDVVAAADRIVLPGVGAFAACMAALEAIPGLSQALAHRVKQHGAPFLGICVGMQLMATRGLEFGETPGLDWISGDVRPLLPAPSLKIPHVGWNTLEGALPKALFEGLAPGAHMYFTHSFVLVPTDPAAVAALTTHGESFAAAVLRDNRAGVQFHPEKSQGAGGRLLANFLRWRP